MLSVNLSFSCRFPDEEEDPLCVHGKDYAQTGNQLVKLATVSYLVRHSFQTPSLPFFVCQRVNDNLRKITTPFIVQHGMKVIRLVRIVAELGSFLLLFRI